MNLIKRVMHENRYITIFIICVLIPVLLISSMLFILLERKQSEQHKMELEYAATRVLNDVTARIDVGITSADTIYLDHSIYQFIDHEYKDNLSYYLAYCKFRQINGLRYASKLKSIQDAVIYSENQTILNGSSCYRIDKEQGTPPMFRHLSEENPMGFTYETMDVNVLRKPEVSLQLVRRLDYYKTKYPMYLLIKYNLDTFDECINFEYNIKKIVVLLDGRVIKSTDSSLYGQVLSIESLYENGMEVRISEKKIIDSVCTVLVQSEKTSLWDVIKSTHIEFLAVFLTTTIMLAYIIRSTIIREQASQRLMLSKVQAEINALNSQVNPHFLYNTLESICMRSVLKGEGETADVIRNLAMLMHKMSTWGEDTISILEESESVEQYLCLQKYRFGDKLNYEIEIEDSCYHFMIPKLSIISLVENACIHGIGHSLEDGTIFVKIREDGQTILITIEDTGAGIERSELIGLRKRISEANIESMITGKGTGLVNTYLRLNSCFHGAVTFDITSIPDKGTAITIGICKNRGSIN